jgi:hypothetical protein
VEETWWEGEKWLQIIGDSVVSVLGVSDAAPEAMLEGSECCSDMKSRTKKLNGLEDVI